MAATYTLYTIAAMQFVWSQGVATSTIDRFHCTLLYLGRV